MKRRLLGYSNSFGVWTYRVSGGALGGGAKKVLVVTGRFGFKTYDVSNPENPVLLDEYMPPGIDPVG